ncbi:glycosyltransferase family 39 protein [Marinobacter sp. R17]|uniref:ArnT family glycosyltransferase n=1 Tax=Marinobacter sp. R17 TaxID=2484250 RepID=UPI000F4C6717|nr:glycosyltransferase family 39 protein [Marinobacter sp. R17]ROT99896.1 glycosyltransferase family 39 protein [Marinobacter sp. R17]
MNRSVSLSQQIYETLTSDEYSRVVWFLLAFATVLIFLGIGLRSPWPADEPRFAEVAREMVDSGQWLIPMRGGEPYPDKPPVFMWSIAFFYWLTGSLKAGFLLPNAICGLITAFLVFDLGARIWNVRVGRNAMLLLLLVPQFIVQAKSAQIDMMVACWITIGCYGLLRHFLAGPAWGWYFVAWAFMGLGIITKGVGFLPALMMVPVFYLAWRRKGALAVAPTWTCLLGPVVMLLVAAAWLVPMVLYVDASGSEMFMQYRDNILFKQTAERYAHSWGHIQPWYYFIANVIPSLWFPLPLMLLAGLGRLREAWRTEPGVFLMLGWIVLVVFFFSMSPGKRGVYILPALPMFALSLAVMYTGYPLARWFRPLIGGIQALLGVVLITVGVLAWCNLPKLVEKAADYTKDLGQLHEAGSVLIVAGLIWLMSLFFLRKQHALLRLLVAMSLTWALLSTWGYSVLEPFRTPRNILANVESTVAGEPDAELGLIEFKEQFILFSKMDVTQFGYFNPPQVQERTAWQWMNAAEHRYVLVSSREKLDCFRIQNGQPMGVAHSETWILLSRDAMTPTCPAPNPDKRKIFTTPNPGRWLD